MLADGDGMLANRRMEEMFGYQQDDLAGHPVESLIPALHAAHHSHRADYAQAPETRPMGAGARLVGLRNDGTTFPVEISLSPIPTTTGQLTLAVIRDVNQTGGTTFSTWREPQSQRIRLTGRGAWASSSRLLQRGSWPRRCGPASGSGPPRGGDSLTERIHARSRQYPAPGGTFAGPSIGCDLDAIERDRSGRGPRPSARAQGAASCLRHLSPSSTRGHRLMVLPCRAFSLCRRPWSGEMLAR